MIVHMYNGHGRIGELKTREKGEEGERERKGSEKEVRKTGEGERRERGEEGIHKKRSGREWVRRGKVSILKNVGISQQPIYHSDVHTKIPTWTYTDQSCSINVVAIVTTCTCKHGLLVMLARGKYFRVHDVFTN